MLRDFLVQFIVSHSGVASACLENSLYLFKMKYCVWQKRNVYVKQTCLKVKRRHEFFGCEAFFNKRSEK